MHETRRYCPVSAYLAILMSLSALPGCRGVLPQNSSPGNGPVGKGVVPAATPSIPLVVKSLVGVLDGRHPTVADLAKHLGGRAVKDDMNEGYQIRGADDRYEEVHVAVSAVGKHPYREEINAVELWLKPGQMLRLSAMGRVFGKPSSASIQTAVAPGPDSVRLGRYSEIITVAFPNVPGSGYHHDPVKNPIQLGLSARLAHTPSPSFPDPLVTVVEINREDWSDLF